MMNRREFLKGAGALAVAAVGGASMILGEGLRPGTRAQAGGGKIPFDGQETLDSIRAKIAANGYSFTVDRNEQYDEFGYPGTPPMPSEVAESPASAVFPYSDAVLGSGPALPSSFDLRNVNGHSYIAPIRNQQGTWICWAFGACAAAEGSYNLKNGLFDDNCLVLSPLYLRYILTPSCTNFGALQMLTSDVPGGGACREIDFPFASYMEHWGALPPAFAVEKAKAAPRVTLKSCGMVYPANYADTTAQIKAAIYRYGAVNASIKTNAALLAYKSGVYEDDQTLPDATPYYLSTISHAISLVGWDDNPPEGGGGCWILRNSFGTSWGKKAI